jgi:hypothetical protein
MKAMSIMLFTLAEVLGRLQAQNPDSRVKPFHGTVNVIAFETRGRFLGIPHVRIFESEDHTNFASAFHEGVATSIPFGVYRIEAYVEGFYSEQRYVAIYQEHVTIVMGLPFGREAMVLPVAAGLHGKIVSSLSRDLTSFVRLTGIYSTQSIEASIREDGTFDLSVPWEGRYLLLVINERGIVASQLVNIPYSGPPLELQMGQEFGPRPPITSPIVHR